MVINHLRKIQVVGLVLFSLSIARAPSQDSTYCDLIFIDHLIKTNQFKEALFLLNSTDCSFCFATDSIAFFKGMTLFSLDSLESSAGELIKINPKSIFYPKSHFFAAYSYAQIGNYEKAFKALNTIEPVDDRLNSLRYYELAGINLIKGDKPLFEEYLGKTDRIYTDIASSSDKLTEISSEMANHKVKSSFLAGLMSGIIPGSGKLYAGKKGDALTAFMTSAGLGLVTWESYRKTGINSIRTILFGTAFVFAYIANIYGSVLSIRISETEYKENVKSTVIFNLRIPLDNTFSK